MKAETLVSLEKAINGWIEEQCEADSDHWRLSRQDTYILADLHELMALAAATAFDANVSGQVYVKEENA